MAEQQHKSIGYQLNRGTALRAAAAAMCRPLKKFITATPDVVEEHLTPDDEFLLMASDGLWDVVSNQVGGGLSIAVRALFCVA